MSTCRECRETVGTYQPTGTPAGTRRAERHPQSAYAVGGYQCPGSFERVDDDATAAREAEATSRWRDGGPSVREFLQSKGEV